MDFAHFFAAKTKLAPLRGGVTRTGEAGSCEDNILLLPFLTLRQTLAALGRAEAATGYRTRAALYLWCLTGSSLMNMPLFQGD